ncbi:MAG: T9SS type A sorting domain-containing protein [Bacteroidia bacterium]|nr:T9SS type A sorting domain-containing protein [Bacteroidia bacterium]NND25231.1 T9SS type A sorting domain-containing protein [Flavobacteriaceae bacterium]NNK61390.1 T9SS type A sorting domain-containing protein [Flavobacteriaceae bacterium]NNL33609.1 T9SS type A sorting domain-containing protein [Flavobacteriaceae bacterium]RZW46120.1 MAG: T9SS type A sorting domain-containing protein [Flavobacteriaceae bacterium]
MKAKLLVAFSFCLCLLTIPTNAQQLDNVPQKAATIGELNYTYVPSIASQIKNGTFIHGDRNPGADGFQAPPKMRGGNNVVPGKGSYGPDPLVDVQRNAELLPTRMPDLIFNPTAGVNFNLAPSDPTGAVGRDFYVAAWNISFRIFNKDGTPASPIASLGTLFGENVGDPIVLYDSEVDRYIVTQFSGSGFSVAISQTNDPVNGGWHIYSPTNFNTGAFPDYTKFSIWSDAYYVTANIGGGNGQVWAIERDEMLNGNPATIQGFFLPGIITNGFYSPQVFNISNDVHPANGKATVVYMADDAWGGVANDHLKLWTIDVDWVTPANSTISAATEIPVTDFTGVFDGGGFSNLTQPAGGPDIDCLQATIMNQAQFRKFGTHNSAVFNFVVDADPGGGELAAVRWYEMRQTADGQPWTIHQEGTYTAPEGRHAFAASMAMDAAGNIGMGYSSLDGVNDERISSRYTGQFAGAPSGVMNAVEELIFLSTTNNGSFRYADYSHLTVDPSDDATFWFDTEVFDSGGLRNVVAAFQLTAPQADDVGISNITAPVNGVLGPTETITVDVRNFGTNSQSNIPVSYTIDGGTAVNDVYPGPLAGGATDSFSFAVTADLSVTNQTYTIVATTSLAGDADTGNDAFTAMVTNAADLCEPTATSGCNVDGIKKFVLGTIDADDGANGCNGNGAGYVDRRNLSTDLDRATGNNTHILQAQHNWATAANNEALSVWIDFDDNGTFDVSERLISGVGFQTNNALEDFDLVIPTNANMGPHVLRAKAIDVTATGDILDPCTDFSFGEVHDYTVNIIDTDLGLDDLELDASLLEIISKPNNQFEITLTTSFSDKLSFSVYNMLGQQLVFNNISKGNDGKYSYQLDMSYASTGVYIVKMGRGDSFVTGRIVVE